MPDNYDFDIGIIGGGAAGLTVASGAAQLGAKTLLVEREKALGGDCLHFGCVPSKTLIRSAQVYHLIKTAPEFGLPAVEPPPVDFQKVRSRIRSVIETIQKHDSEERFCSLGARVEFGDPAFEDEHAIRLNGQTYSAKNWMIATGSSPGIPPIDGLDRTPYLTNREIFYLDRLPESMIVLGAGPIATEMAQAFQRLGTEVTVVQRSGQILSKEDKDMADIVMDVLRAEGVRFYLNASVLRVKETGREWPLTTGFGPVESTFMRRVMSRAPISSHTRRGTKAALWSATPFFIFRGKRTIPSCPGAPIPIPSLPASA